MGDEYISLSTAMRELIGVHELLKEVSYIVFKSSELYTEYYTISKTIVTITQ